jgi:hypothetical protein
MESRQISAYLREHPLSTQVDIDKTTNWLNRSAPPDTATIFEFEAAVVIGQAASGATESSTRIFKFSRSRLNDVGQLMRSSRTYVAIHVRRTDAKTRLDPM